MYGTKRYEKQFEKHILQDRDVLRNLKTNETSSKRDAKKCRPIIEKISKFSMLPCLGVGGHRKNCVEIFLKTFW